MVSYLYQVITLSDLKDNHFFVIGIPPCKAEQQPKGKELQEKEAQKD